MPIEVQGLGDVRRTLRRLRGTDLQRITSETLISGAEEVVKTARRRNWGFTDRTGRLRRSLRVEQARNVRGRFTQGVQLVARTPYAYWVEWKRRTRDRRPGPPYWLNRAIIVAQRRVRRKVRRDLYRAITRIWERG